MKNNKLQINRETLKILTAKKLAAAKGGVRETEPYSFCTLCEPVTHVTCRAC